MRPYSPSTCSYMAATCSSRETSAATRIGRVPADDISLMQISTPCWIALLVSSAPSGDPT